MKSFIKYIGERLNKENPNTYLLIGLGNPGRDFEMNRHNIGFMVISHIAKKIGLEFSRVKSNALITDGHYQGHKVILAKPRTFMNLSGQAVQSLLKFYKIPLENLLLIYDDADLEFETLRLRPEGGSAGQKGVKSVIQHLGTENFPRLRVGLGRPPGKMSTPKYVLQDFSKEQQSILPFVLDRAADAAFAFITEGIDAAMNKYNQKP